MPPAALQNGHMGGASGGSSSEGEGAGREGAGGAQAKDDSDSEDEDDFEEDEAADEPDSTRRWDADRSKFVQAGITSCIWRVSAASSLVLTMLSQGALFGASRRRRQWAAASKAVSAAHAHCGSQHCGTCLQLLSRLSHVAVAHDVMPWQFTTAHGWHLACGWPTTTAVA